MIKRDFKVLRVLEDGQEIAVSTLDNLSEAKRLIASLSEYWPGRYEVLGPDSQCVALFSPEEPLHKDQVGG